jgi:hypothetical protein
MLFSLNLQKKEKNLIKDIAINIVKEKKSDFYKKKLLESIIIILYTSLATATTASKLKFSKDHMVFLVHCHV